MADFARIVAAVDAVNGSNGLEHYLIKQTSLAADSLTGDAFILAVMELQQFEGTSAELLQRVIPDKPPRGWPRNPRAVTTRLRRHAPAMARTGWRVFSDDGQNHDKVIRWSIASPVITGISYPQGPPTRKASDDTDSRVGQARVSTGPAGQPRKSENPLTRTQATGRTKEIDSAGNAGHECGRSQRHCPRCDGEGCRWCEKGSAARLS